MGCSPGRFSRSAAPGPEAKSPSALWLSAHLGWRFDSGSLNRTAIRDALRAIELKDSLLPGQVLRFGKNGQVNTPFVIVQNKPDGKTDIIYPQDAATGQAIAPKPK